MLPCVQVSLASRESVARCAERPLAPSEQENSCVPGPCSRCAATRAPRPQQEMGRCSQCRTARRRSTTLSLAAPSALAGCSTVCRPAELALATAGGFVAFSSPILKSRKGRKEGRRGKERRGKERSIIHSKKLVEDLPYKSCDRDVTYLTLGSIGPKPHSSSKMFQKKKDFRKEDASRGKLTHTSHDASIPV